MNAIARTNTQVATAFLQAIEDGDEAGLDALLAPSFTWWVAHWGDKSRTRFFEAVTRTMRGFDERRMVVTAITAEGERVAVQAEGRFERPGLVYRNSYHYLFIVRNGLVASGREYFDTIAAAAAFTPTPEITP
jgi:ketosteroid isomerase-like protein